MRKEAKIEKELRRNNHWNPSKSHHPVIFHWSMDASTDEQLTLWLETYPTTRWDQRKVSEKTVRVRVGTINCALLMLFSVLVLVTMLVATRLGWLMPVASMLTIGSKCQIGPVGGDVQA